MGMPRTVTLSSVGTTDIVNLDWMSGKPIGISVTGSSSGTFAYTVQYTLDDPQMVTSPSWIADPNATALTSSSSGIYVYTAPLAAIRLNSTAISSAELTLKVNQGIGWAVAALIVGSALAEMGMQWPAIV